MRWESETPELDAILAASVSEVSKIGSFLVALFGGVAAEGLVVSDLDAVMVEASQGPLMLVKAAVLQNPVLSKRVQAYKNAAVASKTMGPEIRELKQKLAAAKELPASLQAIQEISARIPAWDDALPVGSTAEIVDMVQEVVGQLLAKLGDNDCKGLSSLAKTVEHVQGHVQLERAKFFKTIAEKAQEKVQASMAESSRKMIRDTFQMFDAEDLCCT